MALAMGTRLGPYEISGPIGAGGMGEVYKARDTRLGRTVAIKVLPVELAADPERRRRFEQEARAVSALNHPNICALYDIGSAAVPGTGRIDFLVMEFLEGQSLAERLAKGPLPLREAVTAGAQIADALSKAHRQGIIHRDIKPGNVVLTKEGAKLLDFGLAKARPAAAAVDAGATLSIGTAPITQAGSVSGTVPYMAPEQLEGKETDARTDIFAFGALLYEILTGRRAFAGESQASIIAAIMTGDPPPLAERQPLTPPSIERLVRQCLAKDPDKRWQSAGDVARQLEGILEELGFTSSATQAAVAAVPGRLRIKRAGLLGAGLLALGALGAIAYLVGRRGAEQPLPTFYRLTFRRGSISDAAFTPDGLNVIYTARWDGGPVEVYTVRTDSVDSVLREGLRGYRVLAVSAANELALMRGGTLATAKLVSGSPRNVLTNVTGAAWAPDGKEMAVAHNGVIEYPPGKVLYKPAEPGWTLSGLSFSPRGDHLAFFEHQISHGYVVIIDKSGRVKVRSAYHDGLMGRTGWPAGGDEVWFSFQPAESIRAMDVKGRERSVLRIPHMFMMDLTRDGRALLCARDQIYSINAKTPADPVERDLSYYGWSQVQDISRDGRTLLFSEGGEGDNANSWNVFLRGTDGSQPQRLGDGWGSGAISPDGKWVASTMGAKGFKTWQVMVVPIGPGEPRQLSREENGGYEVVGWLPDSSAVAFMSLEDEEFHSWLGRLDGSPPTPIAPPGWWIGVPTPDGKYVLADHASQPDDIVYLYAIDGREKIPLPLASSQWGLGGFLDRDHIWAVSQKEGVVKPDGIKLPRRVYRVNIRTGQAEPWVDIGGQLPKAGLGGLGAFRFSADGKSYAYQYYANLATLYVMSGLK